MGKEQSQPPRVGLVVLGCDKNSVDNEYLAAALARRGALVTGDPIGDGPVDAVVVATCGFTDEARAQSLATILKWAELKRRAPHPMGLYVWSCMGQRWAGELLEGIPELDGVAGVGHFEQLAQAILTGTRHRRHSVFPEAQSSQFNIQHSKLKIKHSPCVTVPPRLGRLRLDSRPYAFLKIADGCNHRCTFCAIPSMKGPLRSVPRGTVLEEARALLASGARELNLIAQDVSAYGQDLYSHYRLADLLEGLLALDGDFWVRLLYVYPGGLNQRLIELLAQHPKLCPYLDLPLQHLDVGVLRRMKRPQPALNIERLVAHLRERIPDLALRTTMMVGFPGEDGAAFERLLAGVERIRFDRLGAFVFSPEEGAPATAMSNIPPRRTALRRLDRLMRLQAEISAKLLEEWVDRTGQTSRTSQTGQTGRTVRVLVESRDEATGQYLGRTIRDAPEVDGVVKLHSAGPLNVGTVVDVTITAAETYDLIGEATGKKGKSKK